MLFKEVVKMSDLLKTQRISNFWLSIFGIFRIKQ